MYEFQQASDKLLKLSFTVTFRNTRFNVSMFASVLYCMDFKSFSFSVIAELVLNDCTLDAVLVQHAGLLLRGYGLLIENITELCLRLLLKNGINNTCLMLTSD